MLRFLINIHSLLVYLPRLLKVNQTFKDTLRLLVVIIAYVV